jgi:hypothetical protein
MAAGRDTGQHEGAGADHGDIDQPHFSALTDFNRHGRSFAEDGRVSQQCGGSTRSCLRLATLATGLHWR